ncbi:hypothetical protein H6F47_24375 [Sphaerospermopsis sp. FACHB-1094]|nr:hypothetical protein [Sphaerospermopsis sp. FACHB-1094]
MTGGRITNQACITNGKSKQYDHLKEVNDALKGLGNQLDQLKNSIKNSEFEGDTLEEAKRLLSTVSRQKDEIQNVLIKVQGGI